MNAERCAIVFDWNGTILADTSLSVRANNETLAVLGKPPVSAAQLRAVYNVPLVHMYKAFGCDEQVVLDRHEELFAAFSSVYETHAHQIRPRRGAKKILREMKARGHKQAVLSNYTVEKIEPQARRLGLIDCFDAILANEAGAAVYNKGRKGDRLKAFIEAHAIRHALVVGDTPEEIEIAQAYGYPGVAITDGVCSTARLRAAKPDFLIRSLEEIPAIAAKVFGKGAA